MGLFNTIMDKLGFGAKPAQAAAPPTPASASAALLKNTNDGSTG